METSKTYTKKTWTLRLPWDSTVKPNRKWDKIFWQYWVLSFIFLTNVAKYLTKRILKEECLSELSLRKNAVHHGREVRRQGHERVGNITSIFRKQREVNVGSQLMFFSPEPQPLRWCSSHLGWALPALVKLIWKDSRRETMKYIKLVKMTENWLSRGW